MKYRRNTGVVVIREGRVTFQRPNVVTVLGPPHNRKQISDLKWEGHLNWVRVKFVLLKWVRMFRGVCQRPLVLGGYCTGPTVSGWRSHVRVNLHLNRQHWKYLNVHHRRT
jgi:hypothetical protein